MVVQYVGVRAPFVGRFSLCKSAISLTAGRTPEIRDILPRQGSGRICLQNRTHPLCGGKSVETKSDSFPPCHESEFDVGRKMVPRLR